MPPRKKDSKGKDILTTRERLFAEGVASGKSMTQAAKDAGYSEKYASDIGKQNSRKLPVAECIQERVAAVAATTDEINSLLSIHLRADMADFDDCLLPNGRVDLKKAKKLGISRLIKKIDYEPVSLTLGAEGTPEVHYRAKIEFHDSQAAAWKLAELRGMKKAPAANPEDLARIKAEIERLVEDGWTEQEARQIVIEAEPRASQMIH